MKKYILIQNDGEIESNSFELIGASTKRNSTGKIGFFGSGLKYSIAYMIRNNIDFRVFSGEKELIFTTTPEAFREQTFDRICINGSPTSYTTTMGPTWTEEWFVLREIYCNAMDESNCQLIRETVNVNSAEGKTRIYIELTTNLQQVIQDWDKYFCMDREPIFTVEDAYTSYLGNVDIGGGNKQIVTVYPKTGGSIFRRGVRIHADSKFAYDYDFQYAEINEDRTAKQAGAMAYVVVNLIAGLHHTEYVKNILRSASEEHGCKEYYALSHTRPETYSYSKAWGEFSEECLLVVKEISGRFADQIARSKKEVFLLPAYFARELKKHVPAANILGMGKSIGNVGMSEVNRTPKMEYLLKEVIKALADMNYSVPYDITVVSFDTEHILGQADLQAKHIYLSDTLFDMGRREIAMTLMEETEHIISGKEDESRQFQNHLISVWLKTMENQTGLFL